MTHQNHQTNGASLEDCHTNFFALVSNFFMYFDSHFTLLYARASFHRFLFSTLRSKNTSLTRCGWILDETPCEIEKKKKYRQRKEAIIAITMLSFFFESERKICVFKAFLLYNT
jgi:hypothetical protein